MKPTPDRVTLDRKQERAWVETRTTFLYNCPAFSHLLYTLLTHDGESAYFTRGVPIAATDGKYIFLNPDTFLANYTLAERVYILGHEVAHAMFGHPEWMHGIKTRGEIRYPDGNVLPFSEQPIQHAMDYFINAMLNGAGIGATPKDALVDGRFTTEMPVIDIYRQLYKEDPKGQGGGQGGGGQGSQGFDTILDPGTGDGQDPTQAAQSRNEQEWKTEIAAALASAKAQGNLPAALERALGELLDPKVDWQEHIRAIFARKIGSGSNDFRRPDRRLITRMPDRIIAPGRSGFGCDTIVVGVDTSGSIGAATLDMFMAEMAGILEDLRPKRLVVMWCDASVHRTDECDEVGDLADLRHKGAPGGGGTDFRPVFDEVEKMGLECDALVYLTDGLGTFGPAPKYPVVWGSIYDKATYPWGDVVSIPKSEA